MRAVEAESVRSALASGGLAVVVGVVVILALAAAAFRETAPEHGPNSARATGWRRRGRWVTNRLLLLGIVLLVVATVVRFDVIGTS